jgi:molybdopterin-guanine dinucleotide biosynthesis protein A
MAESNPSTDQPIPNLGAVILRGGKSSRMGMDKSQLVLQGNTLLDHVIRRVSRVAFPLVIAGDAPMKTGENWPAVTFVCDERPNSGPMEGIRVGLHELGSQVEFAFVTSCDVPLIEPRLIAQLFKLIENRQLVVPVQGSRVYGLTAIYRTEIADEIGNLVKRRQLRVQELVKRFDTLQVDVEDLRKLDPQLNSFTNINDPEDYQRLLARFGERGPSN